MNESEIFIAAAQIEAAELRSAFLESACKSDPEVRQRVEEMLEQFSKWQVAWDGYSGKLAERFAQGIGSSVDGLAFSTPNPSRLEAVTQRETSYTAGARVGSYEILRCLGVGGMGEVYLAHDSRLDRKVALKILPAWYAHTRQWSSRFEREARAASALNHPNILTIHEIGQIDDCRFIAAEFVDGQTLRSLLGTALALTTVLDIAIQIAEALHAAHSANIVHRDIKPENVMVRRDGLVKVLDFGIAKDFRLSLPGSNKISAPVETEPGLIMGTIRYMSPEQAKCIPVDFRADLFCFGIVLFELLTGELPFRNGNDTNILVELQSGDPLRLNRLDKLENGELEMIVKKVLRKDREERYQSAKEIAVDLKQIRRQIDRAATAAFSDPASSDARYTQLEMIASQGVSGIKFEVPEVRYAHSGPVNIAYQILGQGEIDLVFVMGWVSHLDWFWKEPSFARFLNRLASFARLIIFDKRGTGLSDRVPHDQLPTLEQRMDDVRAVMEAAGSERAILCGISEGGPMCSLFAATYPQKTLALVMMGSYARRLHADDYPWGPTPQQSAQFLEEIAKNWGGPVGIETRAPSRANDHEFRSWWATYLRMGASPGAASALTRMNAQIDIRAILKTIQVPTLVLHRSGDHCLLVEEGRYLAEQIPGAKFIELPGSDHLPFVGNQDDFLEPIAEFLTGLKPNQQVNRILATVLCAQVLPGSERVTINQAQLLGLSQAHFVREIDLFRGRTILSTPAKISATFDGPARAIRAAIAVRDSAVRLGVDVQVGLHTGECEIIERRTCGPAVELAEMVASFSAKNEVCVSSTVKDLVAGSGIRFVEQSAVRLSHELPACWLYKIEI